MASNQQVTVGENVQLKSLSDPTINLNAYYQGFVNLQSVEPSLGLPSNITFTSPNSTYYFPVVTVHPTYGNSRKFTNNANLLTINGNNIGIGTATPRSKLTVVGNISARGRLYADDRPYTMLFALSSIIPTKGDNVIYTGIVATPLYSNINGGGFNAIDDSLYSTIAGGLVNNVGYVSHFSFIGGGAENSTCGFFSSIVGGECNIINAGDHSVIVGGMCNAMFSGSLGCQNDSSSIVGGTCNTIMGYCGNFIGGGVGNYMDENTACGSILGGWDNCMINGEAAVILGGARNKIYAIEAGEYPEYDELTNDESYSFIGTGSDNYIAGIHSAILAGRQNSLSGSNSFVLGSFIKTGVHNTTFVNNLSSQGILHGTSVKAITANFHNGKFENDLTVFGNLSVLGTRVEINTNFLNTSAIRVVNPGEGPALYVQQLNSNYDVAQFFTEYDIPVLTIKNSYLELPATSRVGINTSDPNKELTVIGDISASNNLYGNRIGVNTSDPNVELTVVGDISATGFIYGTIPSLSAFISSPYKYSGPTSIVPNLGTNVATGSSANVTGGDNNNVIGDYSTIVGGFQNSLNANYANIGGGRCNNATALYSSIGGGFSNDATNSYSTIGGGSSNIVNGVYSTIGGGLCNSITNGSYSFIGGGTENTLTGSYSIIVGGICNNANNSSIIGGLCNNANGSYSILGSGFNNTLSGSYLFLGGGINNNINGVYSSIVGGIQNTISQIAGCSFIAGGNNNTANTSNVFILGSNIIANTPNYTYVNNLSVQSGNIDSPGTETILTDGINTTGNGPFTLSLNFTNGVYVQNDLHIGNGSNGFDAKIQSTVTGNRNYSLPDSTGTLMVVTSGIRNFAAPIASSSIATVTRTIQVFDSSGNSLGHIPLYATRS